MARASRLRSRLTYEEYLRLPETNRRCGLMGGFLVCEPSPGYDHQRIVDNLHLIIRAAAEQAGGRVILGPFDTVLSREEAWVVQPDLVYVSQAREAIVTARGLAGAPDLAVGAGYRALRTFRRGDRLRSLVLEGIDLDTAAVFKGLPAPAGEHGTEPGP